MNAGGLVPYVQLEGQRSYDGTTYTARLTWLRIIWKASVLAPWGGYGPGNWRPW